MYTIKDNSYHKFPLYLSIDRRDIFHDRLSETKTASNHLQTVEEPKLSSQCQSSTFSWFRKTIMDEHNVEATIVKIVRSVLYSFVCFFSY